MSLLLNDSRRNTGIVDENVQALLFLLDIFGQVSDGLQRGEVQFLHHHVAVPTLLTDLICCNAGSVHIPAGKDYSGSCIRARNIGDVSYNSKSTLKEVLAQHCQGNSHIKVHSN